MARSADSVAVTSSAMVCCIDVLVGLEPLELLVEPDAIEDREQQQDRDQALDRQRKDVDHCASILVLVSSAFSNIAKVVCGLRKRLGDAHRDAVADPAHAAFAQRDVAAAHAHHARRA